MKHKKQQIIIDPTDIKPQFMHPDNRDAIHNPNNHLDNYVLVQDEFQELFNDEFMAVSPHWLMGHAPRFYATSKVEPATRDGWTVLEINPDCDNDQQENSDGKTLNDYCSDRATFNISLKDLEENTNYQGSFRSGRTKSMWQKAADDILNGLLVWDEKNGNWTKKEKTTTKFPKAKKKADYKNKAYKNTAKKAKPSSILLGLIKNNNK